MEAEGTPVLVRTSERSTFRRCPQKWYWRYVDRLAPVREKGALVFGTGVHHALEHYYPPGKKRGPHPARTFEEWFAEHSSSFSQWDDEGNKVDALDLGVAMLEQYVDTYGKDPDIEVIQPEMSVSVDVYDDKGRYVCTLVGKIDTVVRLRSTGRLLLWDHKTAKTIEQNMGVIGGYPEQGLSYLWLATHFLRSEGTLGEDEFIDGIVFNWLRKALPDDRPQNEDGHYLNKDGSVSKRQPPPFFYRQELRVAPRSLVEWQRRLVREQWVRERMADGRFPLYKSPTKDCSWDCEFRDMCELHEMGADWKAVRDFELTTWDPYSDHELEEEKR